MRRLIDSSSTVVSKVDEEALHPLPLEAAERIVHVVGDLVVREGRDANIPRLRVEHECGGNRRRIIDALTPNASLQPCERAVDAPPLEAKCHARVLCAG